MISAADRSHAIELIDEANVHGARLPRVCNVLKINYRTYLRWKKKLTETGNLDDLRPSAERSAPKLTDP